MILMAMSEIAELALAIGGAFALTALLGRWVYLLNKRYRAWAAAEPLSEDYLELLEESRKRAEIWLGISELLRKAAIILLSTWLLLVIVILIRKIFFVD